MQRQINQMRRDIPKKVDEFLQKMSAIGAEKAQVRFSSAKYSGENDVKVTWKESRDGRYAVVASGNATLFIEFGTGVHYPDDHPEKPAGIAGRGEYGKGNGKREAWGYYGSPGNIEPVYVNDDTGLIVTRGSPANRCMYESQKELEDEVERISREVFG